MNDHEQDQSPSRSPESYDEQYTDPVDPEADDTDDKRAFEPDPELAEDLQELAEAEDNSSESDLPVVGEPATGEEMIGPLGADTSQAEMQRALGNEP